MKHKVFAILTALAPLITGGGVHSAASAAAPMVVTQENRKYLDEISESVRFIADLLGQFLDGEDGGLAQAYRVLDAVKVSDPSATLTSIQRGHFRYGGDAASIGNMMKYSINRLGLDNCIENHLNSVNVATSGFWFDALRDIRDIAYDMIGCPGCEVTLVLICEAMRICANLACTDVKGLRPEEQKETKDVIYRILHQYCTMLRDEKKRVGGGFAHSMTAFVVQIEGIVEELKTQQIQVKWRAPLTFKGYNLLQPTIQAWLSKAGVVKRGMLAQKWGSSQKWPETAFNQVESELINDFATSAKVTTPDEIKNTLRTVSNSLGFDSDTGAPVAVSTAGAAATMSRAPAAESPSIPTASISRPVAISTSAPAAASQRIPASTPSAASTSVPAMVSTIAP
ncbi:MAG: hypothetical protein LBF84_03270 [Holosporales bacterium]|nr:hypothetical protein [Holosporales bacterium]